MPAVGMSARIAVRTAIGSSPAEVGEGGPDGGDRAEGVHREQFLDHHVALLAGRAERRDTGGDDQRVEAAESLGGRIDGGLDGVQVDQVEGDPVLAPRSLPRRRPAGVRSGP